MEGLILANQTFVQHLLTVTLGAQVALTRASPFIQAPHRVAGLSLANHTSVRHLLDRTLRAYDKMMERKVRFCTSKMPPLTPRGQYTYYK